MAEEKGLLAILGVDTTEYTGDMRKVLRTAKAVDQAHKDMVDSINAAEKALNKVGGSSGIKIQADTSSAESSIRTLGSLLDTSQSMDITADTSRARSEITAIQGLADNDQSFDVNADTSKAETQLGELVKLAKIDLVVNLAGAAGGVGIPGLDIITGQDRALRGFQARTTREIEGVGDIIEEVYTAAFGESREEVAMNLAQVANLGVAVEDLGSVTAQTFTTSEIGGAGFQETLNAANNLVKTGLAKDLPAALDLITVGFQSGLNISDDLLATIEEYSSIFAEAGISGEEFFSVLQQGKEAGARDTDQIADTYKEILLRTQAAVADSEGTEGLAFAALGQLDEAQAFAAGELTATEYLDGLLTAISEGLETGDILKQDVFDIGGGPVENLTIPVLIKLDPGQVKEEFKKAEGATLAAGSLIYGDLDTVIVEAFRSAESAITAVLDNSFDISGKLETFKTGIAEFTTLIKGGESIPIAIEQAFKIEGFADFFRNTESLLGEILLGTLEVVAGVLDVAGKFEEAASVREAITTQAGRQVAFDIKFAANEDELASAISSASRRGVTDADIGTALSTAVTELISEGNLDAANELLDRIESGSVVLGIEPTEDIIAQIEDFRTKQSQLGVASGLLPIPAELEGLIQSFEQADILKDAIDIESLREDVTEAEAILQAEAEALAPILLPAEEAWAESHDGIIRTTEGITSGMSTMNNRGSSELSALEQNTGRATDGMVESFSLVVTEIEKIMSRFAALNELQLTGVIGGIADGVGGDPTGIDLSLPNAPIDPTTAKGAAAGGRRSGVFEVGEQGRELLSTIPEVAILNNQTSESVISAVGAFLASAPFSSSSNDNRQQSQINNVVIQSDAEAFNSVQDINNQIRGFK